MDLLYTHRRERFITMKRLIPYGILIGIIALFFYKTVLFQKIPFAGDLLLTSYAPWRHVSYSGYVAGAVPSKDQYFDVLRELYPWKTEVLRQIREKTIPLWNPYNFSGGPLLANYQSQIFYPLTILYFLLPQITAWTLLIILQPILGSIFTYLFATSIGISMGGAIIAAVAFNFSSFANVWMEFNTVWHTILWLPLLLYFVEKGIRNKHLTVIEQVIFVFAVFSSMTAGHPQDFITMFFFFLIYKAARIASVKNWSLKEKIILSTRFLMLTTISFLLAAPQLLPTIELFKNSARVPHDYQFVLDTILFQPWQLGLIAVQDFFGNPATKTYFLSDTYVGKVLSIGVVGLFLSFFSPYSSKRKWHSTFFIFACIGLLLFTFNTPVARLFHRYPLPILSTGAPTRILFLFCLSLSVLGGFGFDTLLGSKKIFWKPLVTIGVIIVFLWGFALLHPQFPGLTYTQQSFLTMKKAILFSTGCIGLSMLLMYVGMYKRIILYGFIVLLCGELFWGFNKFNPFVPKEFVYPDNPLLTFFQEKGGVDRIWGYGTAQIEANFTTQYRLFSTDGTDPLNLKWYNEFIQTSRDGNIAKTFNRTTRSDAYVAPGYGQRDLPDNIYRLRVMDSLGVKYIIDRTENPKDNTTFSGERFKEIWRQQDWKVYENLKAAPRYFLTDSFLTYDTPEEFEQKFFDPTINPKQTILLMKKDGISLPQHTKGLATVELVSYKPNKVLFKTHADSTKLLYLSDTYDTGWKATVDTRLTPVYRANYAFRAVIVPAGNHTITFSYQPDSFLWGMRFMFLGIGSITALVGFQLVVQHKRRDVQKTKKK